MIAKLSGRLDLLGEDHLILDVGGVGYLVHCSPRTLRALPRVGEALALLIETQVREDAITLYGFAHEAEKRWFSLLQTVQGVGAKVALAILGGLSPDGIARAIAAGDKATLTRAPGVGPKLATRLVTELKDKVGGIALGPAAGAEPAASGNPALEDAVSALCNLGYKRAEAFGAAVKVARDLGDGAPVQKLITAALRELAR
jgi:Holliday junction DNA helicase RuvA